MVSHDMDSLAKLCEQGVWMDQGRVRMIAPIRQVVAAYTNHVRGAPAQAA